MSAFVCLLQRDGSPVDAALLRRLAEPLADYGSALSMHCQGSLGIAVRHRPDDGVARATVGEVRTDLQPGPPECGPRVDPRTGRVVALVGRLHQGTDPGAQAGEPSRAAGEHRTLHGWGAADLLAAGDPGADFLADADGAFALIVAPAQCRGVRIARDPLGAASVYYHLGPRLLLAASEPTAVLRHPALSDVLDEASAARFLGYRFSAWDGSFYRQVRTLPPAHLLEVSSEGHTLERYWRLPPPQPWGELPDEEIAEDFRRRLTLAVARQSAGSTGSPLALSLSGGLDSTALAAVAADALPPSGLRAFSWTFDSARSADERARVEAVSRHLGLPVISIQGDGLHPLCDGFVDRFVHPNSPYVNPFAALKCGLYDAARAAGCRRVLVGDGGDALYAARELWLRDLLAARPPGTLGDLASTLRRAARGDRFARLALRRLLPPALRLGLRRRLGRERPPWLTAAGLAALPAPAPSPLLPAERGGARYALNVGVKHVELESEERRLFALCGVERGNPFWSRLVLEPAIQLPAYLFHRAGRDKPLTRLAFRGRLPAEVVEGEPGGFLGEVFLRGIAAQRGELLETVFRRPRSDWQRYVHRSWVEPYLANTRAIAFGHTVLWRVISYELWHRRLLAGT